MAWLTMGESVDDLMGMYDPALNSAKPEEFNRLFEDARRRREGHPVYRAFRLTAEAHPLSAITHGTVHTGLIPLFRIHSKERFLTRELYT